MYVVTIEFKVETDDFAVAQREARNLADREEQYVLKVVSVTRVGGK